MYSNKTPTLFLTTIYHQHPLALARHRTRVTRLMTRYLVMYKKMPRELDALTASESRATTPRLAESLEFFGRYRLVTKTRGFASNFAQNPRELHANTKYT